MESEDVDNVMPKFYEQVTLFKQLSRATTGYIQSVKSMKDTLKHFNDSILLFCDENWSRFRIFKSVLEDSENLYLLLEDDITKLGKGFQLFADRFSTVMEARQLWKDVQRGLRQVREQADRVNSSRRAPTVERQQANHLLFIKERECKEIGNTIIERIDFLQNQQKQFLTEYYGKFVAAHSEFCQDYLLIQNTVNALLEKIPK